jgi:hypothetical protein
MTDKNLDRYFIDIRSGCAAVRDRLHPLYNPDYPGLHQDTPDVVEYIHGIRSGNCWTVNTEGIERLKELTDKLNIWPVRDRILKELGL